MTETKLDISWIWSVISLIFLTAIGFIESGQLMGGAIAFVIGLLACCSALLGLIPIVGPCLHIFLVWPAIANTIGGMQPGIHIPVTILLIFVLTTILSIIYCIITTLLVVAAKL